MYEGVVKLMGLTSFPFGTLDRVRCRVDTFLIGCSRSQLLLLP
jgi:hypothetical protein